MTESCIFYSNRVCSNCGECDKCDLYPSKKCNNCGKCLELEGYDVRAVKIEEVFEKNEEISEFEELEELHGEYNKTLSEDDEAWAYIDDIRDLNDIINENNNSELSEEFPGLLLYKKQGREEEEI